MRLRYLSLLLSCWLSAALADGQLLEVRYPGPETQSDHRPGYELELLQLLLEQTRADFGPYRLIPLPGMNTARVLATIGGHQQPNLVAKFSYSDHLADNANLHLLMPPIEYGTVGYRVCFVSPKARAAVAGVRNLRDLQQFTIGQGVGWLDGDILRSNGLQVVELASYASLFRMVAASRIDLFCRGINEWQPELAANDSMQGLALDQTLLLHYPLPRVLATHRDNTELIRRLTKGLQQVVNNGELRRLWQRHYAASVRASNLRQRRQISLHNPLLEKFPDAGRRYLLSKKQMQRLAEPAGAR